MLREILCTITKIILPLWHIYGRPICAPLMRLIYQNQDWSIHKGLSAGRQYKWQGSILRQAIVILRESNLRWAITFLKGKNGSGPHICKDVCVGLVTIAATGKYGTIVGDWSFLTFTIPVRSYLSVFFIFDGIEQRSKSPKPEPSKPTGKIPGLIYT
jgi:hypothetical protein